MTVLIITCVILALIVLWFVGNKIYDAWCAYTFHIYMDGLRDGIQRKKADLNKTYQERAEKARIEAFKNIIKSL